MSPATTRRASPIAGVVVLRAAAPSGSGFGLLNAGLVVVESSRRRIAAIAAEHARPRRACGAANAAFAAPI